MTDTPTEDRLYEMLGEHLTEVHPGWGLAGLRGHRIQSPVEPCNLCGQRVFLMLPKDADRPMWLQFGEVLGEYTLFPTCQTRRHKCGDGDSWSVEAALFVESALASWGVS